MSRECTGVKEMPLQTFHLGLGLYKNLPLFSRQVTAVCLPGARTFQKRTLTGFISETPMTFNSFLYSRTGIVASRTRLGLNITLLFYI